MVSTSAFSYKKTLLEDLGFCRICGSRQNQGGFCNSRTVNRSPILSCLVGITSILTVGTVFAQERITDQVSVALVNDRLLGITTGEGIARLPLAAGEEVLVMEAKGINGFAQTSLRLLGFSGPLQRWVQRQTDVSEHVLGSYVTPQIIVVQGTNRVYGFQGRLGRWKVQDLQAREKQNLVIVKDLVAVLVTDRRALAFSAFTGGFFGVDLPINEPIRETKSNDNIVILSVGNRQLLFRSSLASWTELR